MTCGQGDIPFGIDTFLPYNRFPLGAKGGVNKENTLRSRVYPILLYHIFYKKSIKIGAVAPKID